MAGISDTLNVLRWDFEQAHSKHDLKGHFPKQIERPGVKDENTKIVGKDPIPIRDFDAWYYGGGDD